MLDSSFIEESYKLPVPLSKVALTFGMSYLSYTTLNYFLSFSFSCLIMLVNLQKKAY